MRNMKFKIDIFGRLQIKRPRRSLSTEPEDIVAECKMDKSRPCSDKCSHFSEPYEYCSEIWDGDLKTYVSYGPISVILSLCDDKEHRCHKEEFIDER